MSKRRRSGWPENKNAVHVEGFALEPIGARKQPETDGTGDLFVGFQLYADAVVQLHREQMIDDIEAHRAFGIIDAAHVHQSCELAARIVAQKVSTETI